MITTYPRYQHWGAVPFRFYPDQCAACGSPATQSIRVVPPGYAGDTYEAPGNLVLSCDRCVSTWRLLGTEQALASVILRHQFVDPLAHRTPGIGTLPVSGNDYPLPYPFKSPEDRDDQLFVKRSLLCIRDFHRCRGCQRPGVVAPNGLDGNRTPTDGTGKVYLTVGHIIPQWTAGTFDGDGWEVPRCLVFDSANAVALCWPCNSTAATCVPPLPVAYRLLVKPWVRRDQYGEPVLPPGAMLPVLDTTGPDGRVWSLKEPPQEV